MTISIRVSGDFHQRACPITRNELDRNCDSEYLRLVYRCSRCARGCLKCLATRLNTNSPYARGCEEARLAESNAFPCVCSPLKGCEY